MALPAGLTSFARTLLRIVLALAFAFILLVIWVANPGGGFLESHRHSIWLDARLADDRWIVGQLRVGSDDDENPPAPTSTGTVRFRLEENSMGRSYVRGLSLWRASTWFIREIADTPHGWRYWDDRSDALDGPLHDAFAAYVEQVLIPTSTAVAIWPDESYDLSRTEGLIWWARQTRFNTVGFIATIAICIGLGSIVASLVLPRRTTRHLSPYEPMSATGRNPDIRR